MHIDWLRNYCLSKKGVEESMPFGPDVLVFKVMNKVFLLCPLNEIPLRFNVKCDPGIAIELREQYDYVLPGYHMNKQHWNTIMCEAPANVNLLQQWIDNSYNLVVKSLAKKMRAHLNTM
jgi:predicted DNA-binding protein (MmcQ/YjbR family)